MNLNVSSVDFSNLWWVSQWWIEQELDREEKYGHGLYVRKRARNLPFREETAKQHEEHYNVLLDWRIHKIMNEDPHPPISLTYPRWEMEKAKWEWERYQNWLQNRSMDSR